MTKALQEVKSTHSASEVMDPVGPLPGAPPVRRKLDVPANGDTTPPQVPVEVTPAGRATRTEAFAELMKKASTLSLEEMDKLLSATEGAKTVSEATIIDDLASEEISSLFESAGLSPDFSVKANVIFEGAVGAKVAEKAIAIQEAADVKLQEAIATHEATLQEQISDYLEYVVENYIEANQVAIDKGIKNDITESFLESMKVVFDEHYIDIPEAKVDVVESLSTKVTELENNLNEAIELNIKNKTLIEGFENQSTLASLCEGLDAVSADKLKTLAENITYKDGEDYKARVAILKESVTGTLKTTPAPHVNVLTEETDSRAVSTEVSDRMARYLEAATRI